MGYLIRQQLYDNVKWPEFPDVALLLLPPSEVHTGSPKAKWVLEKTLLIFNLLICTLISKNQGLEKSGSISNHRKFLGSANLDFFFPGILRLKYIQGLPMQSV